MLFQIFKKAVESQPQQIYMIMISLFILSQDPSFNRSIQSLKIPSVPWFHEQALYNISISSLMIIVLVRIVQFNLSKIRDIYLHSNCLATLANVAPFIQDIHPYAAHRIVKLFELLSKRYIQIASRLPVTHKASTKKEIELEFRNDTEKQVKQARTEQMHLMHSSSNVERKEDESYIQSAIMSDEDLHAEMELLHSQAFIHQQHHQQHHQQNTQKPLIDIVGEKRLEEEEEKEKEGKETSVKVDEWVDTESSSNMEVKEVLTDFEVAANESTELNTYADFLHMVLKILNSILSSSVQRNPHLIYALLYQRELFVPFRSHARFVGLVDNVEKVLKYFHHALQSSILGEWSQEKVLEVIKRASLSWKSNMLTNFVQLQFKYEEEGNPEEFFTPFVWMLVNRFSGIHWDPDKIRLFHTLQDAASISSLSANDNNSAEQMEVVLEDPTDNVVLEETVDDAMFYL